MYKDDTYGGWGNGGDYDVLYLYGNYDVQRDALNGDALPGDVLPGVLSGDALPGALSGDVLPDALIYAPIGALQRESVVEQELHCCGGL